MDDQMPPHLQLICHAYEAGVGDGERRAHKVNPYPPWTDGWYAWAHGVRIGMGRPAKVKESSDSASVSQEKP